MRLLIVDEADQLPPASVELLRKLQDTTPNTFGMVFIGLSTFVKRLSREGYLYTRVGDTHRFPSLTEAESRKFVCEYARCLGNDLTRDDLSDAGGVDEIVRQCRGNLRTLRFLLLRIQRVLEHSRKRAPTLVVTRDVVVMARNRLVLGED